VPLQVAGGNLWRSKRYVNNYYSIPSMTLQHFQLFHCHRPFKALFGFTHFIELIYSHKYL